MASRVILVRNQEEHIIAGTAAGAIQLQANDVVRLEGMDIEHAGVALEGRDLIIRTASDAGDAENIRLKDFISAETGAPTADIVGDDKISAEILKAIEPAAGDADPVLEHSQRIGYTGIYDYVYRNLALDGPIHDLGDGSSDDDRSGAESRLTDVPGFYGSDAGAPPPLALINIDGDILSFAPRVASVLDQPEDRTSPLAAPDAALVGGKPGAMITQMEVTLRPGSFLPGDVLDISNHVDGNNGGFNEIYDPITHTLTITGLGTLEQYQDFIRHLTLSAQDPGLINGTLLKRVIDIEVTDNGIGADAEIARATVYGIQPVFTDGNDRRDFRDPNFQTGGFIDQSQFESGLGNDQVTLPSSLADAIRSGYADSLGNPVGAIYGDDGSNGTVGGNDTIFGGTLRDTIYGEAGADNIDGGAGADYLFGGEGNDYLRPGGGGAAADTIDGGAGIDIVDYGNFSNQTVDGQIVINYDLVVNLQDNSRNAGIGAQGDILRSIEAVFSAFGNDLLIANLDVATTLSSGAGNDTLLGGNADDQLFAGTGNDLMDGGAGNDLISAGGEALGGPAPGFTGDTLLGGVGNDTLLGGTGIDTLEGGEGADQLDGGVTFTPQTGSARNGAFGDNTASYEHSAGNGVRIDLTVSAQGVQAGTDADGDFIVFNVGASTIQNIIGSDGNDTLKGDIQSNRLQGGNGNDILTTSSQLGASDFDTLDGGSGDDLLISNGNFDGKNVFAGGSGNDVLRLLNGRDLNLAIHVDAASHFSGIETIDLVGALATGIQPASDGNHTLTLDLATLQDNFGAGGGTLRILADAGDTINLLNGAGTWTSATGPGSTTIWTNSQDNSFRLQVDTAAAINPVP